MSTKKSPPVKIDKADPEKRKEIGARLRAIREALQLSQGGVADRTGFSHGYISRCERGERIVSSELAMALRVRMKVNDQYLQFGQGPMFAKEEPRSWEDLDAIVADLADVVERLRGWRMAVEGPTIKSNAKITGVGGGRYSLSEIREAIESLKQGEE
jgi:transcriptional regulator with XRE-family HTH domain